MRTEIRRGDRNRNNTNTNRRRTGHWTETTQTQTETEPATEQKKHKLKQGPGLPLDRNNTNSNRDRACRWTVTTQTQTGTGPATGQIVSSTFRVFADFPRGFAEFWGGFPPAPPAKGHCECKAFRFAVFAKIVGTSFNAGALLGIFANFSKSPRRPSTFRVFAGFSAMICSILGGISPRAPSKGTL